MEFSYALSKEMQHKAFISPQDQLCIRTTNDKLNLETMSNTDKTKSRIIQSKTYFYQKENCWRMFFYLHLKSE